MVPRAGGGVKFPGEKLTADGRGWTQIRQLVDYTLDLDFGVFEVEE